MKEESFLSCHDAYVHAKKSFVDSLNEYDESDDEKINEKVRHHLIKMVDLIDSMISNEDVLDEFNDEIERLIDLSAEKKPIQALVFFFDSVEGSVQFNTYGSLNPKYLMPTELSLNNRFDNLVMGPMGPILFSNYSDILEDAVYFEEVDGMCIEEYNDGLRELCNLKAYSIFEEHFLNLNVKDRITSIDILAPFYVYIQEHDGGMSNRLA